MNLYRRLFSPLVFIVCQTMSGCVKSLINYSAHCSTNSFRSYFPAPGTADEVCAKCPSLHARFFALSKANESQMLDGKSKFTNENNRREESDSLSDFKNLREEN